MNETILSIRELTVSHAQSNILNRINLEIPSHRVTVILGPSGCGKTTLLKCLNCLIALYNGLEIQGSICLHDLEILHSCHDLTTLRQKMGLLSQRPYPLPMSIFDNIAYGLKIQGLRNRHEIADRVAHYLDMVGLWEEVKDRLKSPATRLSIGQQQRLCLARGLAVEPEIILADEPTSALDPISSTKIEEQFLALKEQYTIIIVTHIMRQARRLADHVVFMYLGEIIEQGTPEEVFDHPKNPTTQRYLTIGH